LSRPYNNAISSENIKNFCFLSIAYLQKSFAMLINIQADEIRLMSKYNNTVVKYDITFANEVRRNLKNLSRLHILMLLRLEFLIKVNATDLEQSSLLAKNKTQVFSPQQSTTLDACKNHNNKLHFSNKNDGNSSLVKSYKRDLECICLGKFHGRCLGNVTSACGSFYDGISIVQTCLGCKNLDELEQELFCYSAMKETKMLIFCAYPLSIKFTYEKFADGIAIKVEGLGCITLKERSCLDKNDVGSFIFTVYYNNDAPDKNNFEMQILAKSVCNLNHSSGKIYSKCSDLLLKI
jgi:hypothetical protein